MLSKYKIFRTFHRTSIRNTIGRGYPEDALQKQYIFKGLSGIATFLIERKKIPMLPTELIERLSYNFAI